MSEVKDIVNFQQSNPKYPKMEILLAKVRCILHLGTQKQQEFIERCIESGYSLVEAKLMRGAKL